MTKARCDASVVLEKAMDQLVWRDCRRAVPTIAMVEKHNRRAEAMLRAAVCFNPDLPAIRRQ
jgi:hypothetical protein